MTSKHLELHRPTPVARDDIVTGTPEQIERAITRLREQGFLIAVSKQLTLADGSRAVKVRHRAQLPIFLHAHPIARQPEPVRRMPIDRRTAVGLITGTIIACLIIAATFGPIALAGIQDVTVSAAPVLITLAAIAALVLVLSVRTTHTRKRRKPSAHHCSGCRHR